MSPLCRYGCNKRKDDWSTDNLHRPHAERYNVKLQAIEFDTYEQMHDALFDDRIDIMFPVYGSYWIAEENSRANRQFAEQIYQPPIWGG